MKFKSQRVEEEFYKTSLFLQRMAEDFDKYSIKNFKQEIIITRVREKIEGSSGVHEDNRAFDVRDEFMGGFIYTVLEVKELVSYMNTRYPRNDGKVTCIHHSFQDGPLHFHVQLATLTKTYEPVPEKPETDEA